MACDRDTVPQLYNLEIFKSFSRLYSDLKYLPVKLKHVHEIMQINIVDYLLDNVNMQGLTVYLMKLFCNKHD